MRRAAAAVALIVFCSVLCLFLSDVLADFSSDFTDASAKLVESSDDNAKAEEIYSALCSEWLKKKSLFAVLSGRHHTNTISESLRRLGAAIESKDDAEIKTEAAALFAKFEDIKDGSILKKENLM